MFRQFALLACLLFTGLSASAQSTMKILTAGAFKQMVVAFVPAFEARTGVKVEVVNDTAGALVKRIDGGESFDLLFLTPAGLKAVADAGRVDPSSIRPVARTAIGVAVKTGSPSPAIDTAEQFKAALLAARKVAYIDPASGGSSGIYLEGLFQKMGIADAMHAKAVLVPGGLVAERVANGEADLAIHQISEILPVQGVTLVGPIPAAVQNYTVYGYGVAAKTPHTEAVASFLAMIGSPDAVAVIKAKGMEPVQP